MGVVTVGCFQGDRFNTAVLFALFYVVGWLFITPGSSNVSFVSGFSVCSLPPPPSLRSGVLSVTLWQIKAAKSKTLPPMFTPDEEKQNHWHRMMAWRSRWRAGLCVSNFDQPASGLESSMSGPIRPEPPSYWHSEVVSLNLRKHFLKVSKHFPLYSLTVSLKFSISYHIDYINLGFWLGLWPTVFLC